uniref:Uncharacterized protein n=1 Tax=Amblyomma triste TaxID=251400 RepID=A0A023GAT7_AMBTT
MAAAALMRSFACSALRMTPRPDKIPADRLRLPVWSFRACSHVSLQENEPASRVPSIKANIFEALKGYPVSSDHLYEIVVQTLLSHGFDDKQVVQVIAKAPRIVELHSSLGNILTFWRSLYRSEPAFLKTMSEYPELIYLRPEAVEERKRELFTVFPNKDIVKLAETCPQVFIDDWDMVMEKVYYITHAMVISPGHIISSGALSYSLLHIKTRHQFMLCCGKYRTPKPKEVTTTNPPLAKIVGLPLRLYLNICGVTAEEYDVFEKLMAKEKEREDAEDSDDDLD